jgi:hypothetical protein
MGLRVNDVRGRLRAPLPAGARRGRDRVDALRRSHPRTLAPRQQRINRQRRVSATGLRPGLDRGTQSQHYFRFRERNAFGARQTTAKVASTDSPTIRESLDETALCRRMPPGSGNRNSISSRRSNTYGATDHRDCFGRDSHNRRSYRLGLFSHRTVSICIAKMGSESSDCETACSPRAKCEESSSECAGGPLECFRDCGWCGDERALEIAACGAQWWNE